MQVAVGTWTKMSGKQQPRLNKLFHQQVIESSSPMGRYMKGGVLPSLHFESQSHRSSWPVHGCGRGVRRVLGRYVWNYQ